MHLNLSIPVLGLVVALTAPLAALPARILGTNPFNNDYVSCDMSTGNVTIEASLTGSAGQVITGANAITMHPTTLDLYVIVKIMGQTNRSLGTLNIDTGVVTVIGDTGQKLSSLAFDDAGVLWTTSGNGSAIPETLWTIDLATGVLTLQAPLGLGADGEIIVFNPNDGLLYHFSGNGTVLFESIDRVTLTTTPIAFSGDPRRGEIFGALWDNVAGNILVSDIASAFDTVTTTGVFTLLPLTTVPAVPPMPPFGTDDVRGLVDLATTCAITAPLAGASVSGDVAITFDATTPGNSGLDTTFEFSTDAGATWAVATAAATSMLPSPDLMRPSPISGATFLWDTASDAVALVASQAVDLRITTTNSLLGTSTCVVTGVMVEPPCLCGDCDLNATAPTILDALSAAQIAAGLIVANPIQTRCCDINSSMSLTILDALGIAQSAAGLPTTLTCP